MRIAFEYVPLILPGASWLLERFFVEGSQVLKMNALGSVNIFRKTKVNICGGENIKPPAEHSVNDDICDEDE